MIDLHVHILPALDDGPRDMEEAVAMARCAAADGVRAIVATPHVMPGVYNNSKKRIFQSVEELNNQLKKLGISLDIYPGAEYMLDPALPGWLKKGEALTINDGGKFLLIEFPSAGIPPFAEQTLYEISLQGVTPVIAHPERNADLIRFPEQLLSFTERGALTQITAGSLTGLFGRSVRRLAMYYLENGLGHFIGTDAHNIGRRAPSLSDAARCLAEKFGREREKLLTVSNPARLLEGQTVIIPDKTRGFSARKRGFWDRWKELFGKSSNYD